MSKKMLIDATHPEETRVVIVHGNKLEDFDFESAARKQLIGNIYLAKVTRIEPSLQAAFVDYGGNRHGFLAFNEIHPDYYQIPVADRQALLQADAAEEQRAEDADEDVDFTVAAIDQEEADSDDSPDENRMEGEFPAAPGANDDDGGAGPGSGSQTMLMAVSPPDTISSGPLEDPGQTTGLASEDGPGSEAVQDLALMTAAPEVFSPSEIPAPSEGVAFDQAAGDQPTEDEQNAAPPGRRAPRRRRNETSRIEAESRQEGDWREGGAKRIESVGGEDALDEVSRPRARRRQYKIQEVIKKRQIMLVQILKDERGSKGAALTTHLSIPGRYCVLMPNTARGGGISRKITNAADRKRLKAVAAELEVPEGMGLIIRTAGANRTKTEIKRDFDYLLRQWETIRELTLRSTAPCLINEEGSVVKRAVRDLYDKDIEIIQVEGEASYREAKDFMRMLMPSHAKKVQPYREPVPLFQRYQVEAQLDSMFDPTVRLKSGGYIVINPTEALVSIDVNSGKSTREANIEATATRTNMEAAEEVARQLRLRDLAGLIVIDFIDMDNLRNNKSVERKLKECLASDRANIQIGRISPFGLLEMSRQRLRQGVVETTTRPCANCHGTGLVRSVDSLALRVLRGVEEECQRQQHHVLDIFVPPDVAIYILNQKRQWLHQIEARSASSIFIIASPSIQAPNFEIKPSDRIAIIPPPLITAPLAPEVVEAEEAEETLAEVEAEDIVPERPEGRDGERRRRRDRGRAQDSRGSRRDTEPASVEDKIVKEPGILHPESEVKTQDEPGEEEIRRRKMRRRRRGRGRNRDRDEKPALGFVEDVAGVQDAGDAGDESSPQALIIPILSGGAPAHKTHADEMWHPESAQNAPLPETGPAADEMAEPVQETISIREPEPAVSQAPETALEQELPEAPAGPKRGGWWQRQFGKA